MTSMLANDVQAKQPERDKLAADSDKWIAKHGKPICHGPEVSAAAGGDHYATRLAETSAAKRRRGKS